ncbi:MAG: pirin family protein, partial [Lewinella sp.]|nr:pirin family protein [Lewinella sp.]
EALEMGHTIVKQPLPTQRVERIDPFLLLHHFGPYDVEPGHDPLDVGPHPHRGFEPVTFLYQGSIRHRDSRNNTGHLDAGDVQWMTAGRGIIHSERASREFRENGGILEGIQLWINLPKAHKMVQPRYQDIKAADLPAVQLPNEGGRIRVVAGAYGDLQGAAQTHTPMVALQAHLKAGGQAEIPLPESHNALIYIVKGEVRVNGTWTYSTHQLLHFRLDGEGIALAGVAPESEVLVLSGEPIGEPVTQWGPYVMTTQTEIMEAMRDYQMGKMGFYTEY